MQSDIVNISVGAGFENDRRDLGTKAVRALSLFDGPRYLIFECLAERTLALQATADRRLLGERAISFLEPCLEQVVHHKVRIVSNFGGPDPCRVAADIRDWLFKQGVSLRVCAVTGDALPFSENDIVARNAYTGAAGIVAALSEGADIVVAGRVADPSLTVGPVAHELGLNWDDFNALANATLAGHLIECGTQVSGGYFADHGLEVDDLANVGPPVAQVSKNRVVLRKPVGGGRLDRATVTQQLLYEVHDPSAYLTPDVTLDMSGVEIDEMAQNVVELIGVRGHPPPPTLKVLTCRQTQWLGEAEICYAGTTADTRVMVARDVILAQWGTLADDLQLDCITGRLDDNDWASLRVAVRSSSQEIAKAVLDAVEALYVNGPAAGGGVRRTLTRMIETEPGYIDRKHVGYELDWGDKA